MSRCDGQTDKQTNIDGQTDKQTNIDGQTDNRKVLTVCQSAYT